MIEVRIQDGRRRDLWRSSAFGSAFGDDVDAGLREVRAA